MYGIAVLPSGVPLAALLTQLYWLPTLNPNDTSDLLHWLQFVCGSHT